MNAGQVVFEGIKPDIGITGLRADAKGVVSVVVLLISVVPNGRACRRAGLAYTGHGRAGE